MRHELRGDWPRASRLEWLETNGIGGYASATVSGANTRRYHGLLVAAIRPPVGRMVLLSKLDERITAGGASFDLASNQFPGVVHPRGFEYLDAFERDLFPAFEYSVSGVKLRKTIAAIQGENTIVIVYEASADVTLELRPFIAARDYHSLQHANDAIHRQGHYANGLFSLQAYDGVPAIFLSLPGAMFDAAPDWYYRFEYPVEQERGLDAHEDLFTPGTLTVTLHGGVPFAVIASTDDPSQRDGLALLERERWRRERIGGGLFLAAGQFLVQRGKEGRSVIAGYHWFTDWGRDTMISLTGLCLTTGRFDDARRILLAYSGFISQGMLPNRFPDGGEAPEYNTADATLWFFIAVKKYLESSGDEAFVRDTMLPLLRNILAWHTRGTRHDIHEDADGLLSAGREGDQLTWMDAKIGDYVVTPRHGKPVEIEALWYNALLVVSELEERWGSAVSAGELAGRASRARESFRRIFWNSEARCLYDVVRGEERDASIRPNQIFALSLPHPLLDGEEAEGVLRIVEERLLTPFGLRTLDPADPRFVPRCTGPPHERDRAYHQGTVWAWLLGPFITALARVRGEAGVTRGRQILEELQPHIDGDACVGSISEIFDGAPPHTPRGCIAQAWSVAEVLRVQPLPDHAAIVAQCDTGAGRPKK
jgi:predicted glycogen debranching enzyme